MTIKQKTIDFLDKLIRECRDRVPGVRKGYYEYTSGFYYHDECRYNKLDFWFGLTGNGDIMSGVKDNVWLPSMAAEEATVEKLLAAMDKYMETAKRMGNVARRLGFKAEGRCDHFRLDLCGKEIMGDRRTLRLMLEVRDEELFELKALSVREDGCWQLLDCRNVGWFKEDKVPEKDQLAGKIHNCLFRSDMAKHVEPWLGGKSSFHELPEWLRMERVEARNA